MLVVFFLLKKFAWKGILKALDDRESKINEALQTAERTRQEMTAMKSEHEKLLNDAKAERSAILKEAKDLKDQIIAEARVAAKAEQSRIVGDALKEIENQKMAAMTEIKNSVGSLVIEVSTKVLGRELKEKAAQQEYAQQLVKDAHLN